MNDNALIACGAGLHDSLNPCMLINGAVFLALVLWLQRRSWRLGLCCFLFVFLYALGEFLFNFGPQQGLVLNKLFLRSSKILYIILSVGAFVLGVINFKEWSRTRRENAEPTAVKVKTSLLEVFGSLLCLLIAPVALSAMATLFPLDRYVMILGNMAIMRGQSSSVWGLLSVYIPVSLLLFWVLWAFLAIKKLRPSLRHIVSAAVFFAAWGSVFFILKL